MIVDTLENLKNYVSVNPLFADVIDFLSKTTSTASKPASIT